MKLKLKKYSLRLLFFVKLHITGIIIQGIEISLSERSMSNQKLVSIGNYALSDCSLGKGSFAFVNKSRHSVLQKDVALKVMMKNKIKDDYVSRHYKREAYLLSQLRHPNIVKLVEVFESKDFFCIAMELCSNGSLLDVLNDYGGLGDIQVRRITRQIVYGLVYIHSKGIIHRDLKLENILLADGGRRVVLADFGLSSNWHHGKKMNTFPGTVEYAAPELFHKNPNYGPKVDVWSLGIIVYALAIGRLPFRSNTGSSELIRAICRGLTSTQHLEMKTHLSPSLRAFLLQCIEPKCAGRWTANMLQGDTWLTCQGLNKMKEWPEDILTDQEELDIASAIQEGLKIKLSPEKILEHLKKRPFYMTGGCFNLLSLEILHRKRYKIADKTEQTKPEPPTLSPAAVQKRTPENLVCESKNVRYVTNATKKDCGAKVRAGALGNITNKPVKIENPHCVKAAMAPPEPMVHPASTIHGDLAKSSGKSATRQKIRMMR